MRHHVSSEDEFVFFYINEPCVVVGKNQSLFKEVNREAFQQTELKICRRISGGGTVYQDLGNLNFCFIQPFAEHKINNYRWFNQPLVNALNQADIAATMDSRNNLMVSGKKISGNAQFTDRKRMMSHGTLLFNADLTCLRQSLRENEYAVESKSVSSVRSSVVNLSTISSRFKTIDELQQYLISSLGIVQQLDFSEQAWNTIINLSQTRMSSFEWVYGRSPKTTIHKSWAKLVIENGRLSEVKTARKNVPDLLGCRYTFSDIKTALENYPNAAEWCADFF